MKQHHRRLWYALAAAGIAFSLAPAARADAPAYGYTFTPEATTGTPRILKVELNSDALKAGGPIAIRVTTTTDVTQVTTGNGKRQGTLTKVSPGVFTSASTLPHVGGLISMHIKLHFVATAANGTTAS